MTDAPQISEPVVLDDIDRAIIPRLHENARIPNVDLARAVGVSASTCLARVRSLRERGVIVRYTAEIDPVAAMPSSKSARPGPI